MLGLYPLHWVIVHQQSAPLYAGDATRKPKQVAAGWLTTKRVLAVLFLLGPWLVQLVDQAGLLHHPWSHLTHALVNVFSALWAIAVVGIALNGGLADLRPSITPAGQESLCLCGLSAASRRGCQDWRQSQDPCKRLCSVLLSWHKVRLIRLRMVCIVSDTDDWLRKVPMHVNRLMKIDGFIWLISGTAGGPQAEPEGLAQSIAPPPPSDVRIKLMKAEVEEQWGGKVMRTQRAPRATITRHP